MLNHIWDGVQPSFFTIYFHNLGWFRLWVCPFFFRSVRIGSGAVLASLGGRWSQASSALDSAVQRSVRAAVVSRSAVISACNLGCSARFHGLGCPRVNIQKAIENDDL